MFSSFCSIFSKLNSPIIQIEGDKILYVKYMTRKKTVNCETLKKPWSNKSYIFRVNISLIKCYTVLWRFPIAVYNSHTIFCLCKDYFVLCKHIYVPDDWIINKCSEIVVISFSFNVICLTTGKYKLCKYIPCRA
jgi:hypothetical protein